jgi:hypothetical protein
MEGNKGFEGPKTNPQIDEDVFQHQLDEEQVKKIDYEHEPYQERGSEEEYFQDYVETLELTPEDFEKDIIDIGGAEGSFAYYALEHGINDHIATLEPMKTSFYEGIKVFNEPLEHNSVPAESYDLVISNHSMPGYLYDHEHFSYEENVENMKHGIDEMLRMVRPRGEVRVQWSFSKVYEPLRGYAKASLEVIRYLQAKGIGIDVTEDSPTFECDHEWNETRILRKWFKVRLTKPEK